MGGRFDLIKNFFFAIRPPFSMCDNPINNQVVMGGFMLLRKDGFTFVDVVMRNYEPGHAFLHAQHLRDKYGKNVSVSYCIRNRVPEFKFRLTLKEKCQHPIM
ncbi:hypothetical protein D1615_21445 [Klebsiella pneumoniae]|nr:hypothetical protein D1615_21445 [Klebsiella pneumoniae]